MKRLDFLPVKRSLVVKFDKQNCIFELLISHITHISANMCIVRQLNDESTMTQNFLTSLYDR